MHDLLVAACSGAFAGLVTDTALYPLDYCKSRLNAPRPPALPALPAHPVRALAVVAREALAEGGWRALFRGWTATLVLAPAAYALYFGGFEGASATGPLVAGFCAEAAATPVYIPYDVIKQRVMISKDSTVWRETRAVWRRDGPRGFFRGVTATFLTYGPFSALYFYSYEGLVAATGDRREQATPATTAACATAAGAFAGAATQPLDWLKTRVQISKNVSSKLTTVVSEALATEGTGVVFRGTLARALWLGPSCGLTMVLYEACRRKLTTVTP